MDILWNEKKNKKLKDTRGVSLEDIAQIILDKKYLAVLENPADHLYITRGIRTKGGPGLTLSPKIGVNSSSLVCDTCET